MTARSRAPTTCPLCLTSRPDASIVGADGRRYAVCPGCSLIFADRQNALSREEQRAHYRTHENSIDNAGYIAFLRRVIDPLLPSLDPSMRGLDFGCGPGPTLSQIVRQCGLRCDDYDPLFADRPLEPPYDFVFATECFEHFVAPACEVERIRDLLVPGGYLGIMTELWTDLARFESWYYTRDPTHVSFFHRRTIDFVCERYDFQLLQVIDGRVVLLRRTAAPTAADALDQRPSGGQG